MIMQAIPNFICVGAQKAGTTTLYNILSQHPHIYLPKEKETKFFQRNFDYAKGLNYYSSEYFSKVKIEKCIGEIDPEYLYFESVPYRIYETLGDDIKILFLLRNPVDRAYSHYLMSVRRGYETCNFLDALEKEPDRLKDTSNDTRYFSQKSHFSYIDRGLYAKQIRRYLKYFKKENMHFILFEQEFFHDKRKTINELLEFLCVNSDVPITVNLHSNPATMPKSSFLTKFVHKENKVKNILKYLFPNNNFRRGLKKIIDSLNQKKIHKKALEPAIRKKIFEKYFKNDVGDLEKIIGKNLEEWR